MRRKWVWDPEVRELVEVSTERRPVSDVSAPMVHGDMKPFISPRTGESITDRGHWRRHLKAYDLAPYEDVSATAKRVRAERERAVARDRKQRLIESYERTRDAERARSRFG